MDTPLAPLRPRHDGWTPARQWAFIQALADSGAVGVAARQVGMSESAAYRLRRHPAAADFRAAWDAALADGWRRIEETAMARAINGETEVIERGGETMTRHRPCSARLMMHMLDRAAAVRAAEAAARAAAEAAAAKARVPTPETLARVRADIRALADVKKPRGAAARAAAARADAIAEAEWQAEQAARETVDPILAGDAEAAGLMQLYRLGQGFADRQGWEGPAAVAGDGRVPVLPMPERTLSPASVWLASTVRRPRLRDGAAVKAVKAPNGTKGRAAKNVRNTELPELPKGPRVWT